MKWFIIIFIVLTVIGCKGKNEITIEGKIENAEGHTFEIQVLDNETFGIKQLIKIDLDSNGIINLNLPAQDKVLTYFRIDRPKILETILRSGEHLNFSYNIKDKNSLRFSEDNKFNELIHVVSHSYSDFVRKNNRRITSQNDLLSFRPKLDSFAVTIDLKIDSLSPAFTKHEIVFLKEFNKSKKYEWLFLMPNRICGNQDRPDIKDGYYDFINEINLQNVTNSFFPFLIVRKLLIQFERDGNGFQDIVSFWDYMSSQIKSKELRMICQGWYLNFCLDAPTLVHQDHYFFDNGIFNEFLYDYRKLNSNTTTIEVLENKIESKKSLIKGTKAKDFIGFTGEGDAIKLSDFYGKTIFLEIWSTKGSPCYDNRPQTLEFIDEYKDRGDIVFLLVSIDRERTINKWHEIVTSENLPDNAYNLIIEAETLAKFIEDYQIKSLSKYILIDENGKFIRSVGRKLGIEEIMKEINQGY